jgi:pimeloyl-ACP methyl ester carboxylesterase
MATFVLVHGAWEAGWIYAPMARLLAAQGHEVFRPTMTGLGERAHLATPAVDLETHIADVRAVLEVEDLRDVTLVGHSYGGMIAGSVADRAPDRVRSLIYLDAFIPEDGKAQLDMTPGERRAAFEKLAAERGGGWRLPLIPAKDWDVTDPGEARLLDTRCVPHPIATMRQKARLTGKLNTIPKIAFILAVGGKRISPFPPFAAKARAAGWPVEELASHHFTMLSKPRETADLLVRHAA